MMLRAATVTKSWFILLSVVFVLAACQQVKEVACSIPIGVIYPSSDPVGNSEQQEGFDTAVKEINQSQAFKDCPMKLVQPDSQTAQSQSLQADVVNLAKQNVVAMLSPASNDAAKRVAQVSHILNVPVVIPSDIGDDIGEMNSPWIFRLNPTSRAYADTSFTAVISSSLGAPLSVAILFEHSEYGESAAVAAGEAALAKKLPIVLYQRYSRLEDVQVLLPQIQQTQPSIVYLIGTQPDQAESILNLLADPQSAGGVTFRYMIWQGSSLANQADLYNSSGGVNPVLATFNSNTILNIPWIRGYTWSLEEACHPVTAASELSGSTTANLTALHSVQAYVSVHLTADAIQTLMQQNNWKVAGKSVANWQEMLTNPDNIASFREYLAQAIKNTQGCPFGSVLWPVKFSDAGQNVYSPLLITTSGGELKVIYP